MLQAFCGGDAGGGVDAVALDAGQTTGQMCKRNNDENKKL